MKHERQWALILFTLLMLLAGCTPIQLVRVSAPPAGSHADSAVQTTVLYATGFETDDFTPGALNGQSGWFQWVGQPGGAEISTAAPASGAQSLSIDGALMAPVPDRPWSGVLTYFAPRHNIEMHDTPILEIEADVRLDGPGTDIGTGLDDDKVSANLVAIGTDGSGSQGLAFNQLSSSEKVITSGGASAPVTLGEYHRLGLRLDFAQQTAEYFLDGVSIGVEPFRDTRSAQGLVEVRLDLAGAPDVGQQYKAYYDNLVIKAGPAVTTSPHADN
jgi:hypothetical protein